MVMWMMKIKKLQQQQEKKKVDVDDRDDDEGDDGSNKNSKAGGGLFAIINQVLHTSHTHGMATATAAAPSKREDKDLVVLLPFVWFPLDDTLFIAPDMYNTDSNIITNSPYTVIREPIHLSQHATII